MDYTKIDFDHELDRGPNTYNQTLGQWWLSQSSDRAHSYAYSKITQHLVSFFGQPPERIIDYACGAGHMLTRLYRCFSNSKLTGIDGSSLLLKLAGKRLQSTGQDWRQRVHLIETNLPDCSLPRGQADVLLFVFPNIVPDPDLPDSEEEKDSHHPEDRAVADYLALTREPNPEEETVEDDPETLCDSLITDNLISRNLRRLLKKGGVCVRADYANAPRNELTKLVEQRLAFQEGSLQEPVNGLRAEQLFKVVGSTYYRSKVLEDVYHQTRDKTDKDGGYLLTTLVAL
ncbi:MAG: class I SAM-dependent methyltransferase [Acidobacteria bacterium]|nr:class I SAM-dependent methyltransferase [Acidobacteriota bacterium]